MILSSGSIVLRNSVHLAKFLRLNCIFQQPARVPGVVFTACLGSIFLTFSGAKPTLVRITNVNRPQAQTPCAVADIAESFFGVNDLEHPASENRLGHTVTDRE